MKEIITEHLCRQYWLELMGCFLDEASKIKGLEKLELHRATHRFLTNENNKENAEWLASVEDRHEYEILKTQLTALLERKKAKLKEVLDVESISAHLKP